MGENDGGDDGAAAADRRTFEAEYGETPPSMAIVEAIAAHEDVSPSETSFTLYESVDPDALDALFRDAPRTGQEGGAITTDLRVGDYRVTVSNDGTIVVEDLA